jgi:hypothetical protein
MSKPNTVDYANSGDYPTDPDTINYNYNNATYNEPRPIESNYILTNYDITNYPKTDYNKFNANLTNYMEHDNKSLSANGHKFPNGTMPLNTIMCESPDMLYQVPRDPQYSTPTKYMCFNNRNKLIEITQDGDHWLGTDLTKSVKHVKWEGSQCKITSDKCTKNNLTEDCEATCYVSPNDAFVIKYKNNIWRRPDLEDSAGACTMTAISEQTAQNSFCKCDNVLERPNLKTKANMDKNRTGKFWCSA